MESVIAHASAAAAEVNAPALVTLYAPTGRAILVDERDAEYWLGQGFVRSLIDPAACAAEITALLPTVAAAIEAYVRGVLADGQIDTADAAAKATADAAFAELEQAWGKLNSAIALRFPVAQGAAVTMRKEGQTTQVDPGQVAAFAADGWEVA